jgi:ketosteroid isomerase-like protein
MIPFPKLVCSRITFALVLLSAFGALSLTVYAAPKNGGMPRGQRHECRREIEQLEDTWRNAVLKGNADAMDSLLAADYMAITPNGTMQSREEMLDNIRSDVLHITSFDVSDRKVRFYGKTALVNSRIEVSGTTAEGDISGSFRHIRVYVRDAQGKWKIVSFEASRIREPGERK